MNVNCIESFINNFLAYSEEQVQIGRVKTLRRYAYEWDIYRKIIDDIRTQLLLIIPTYYFKFVIRRNDIISLVQDKISFTCTVKGRGDPSECQPFLQKIGTVYNQEQGITNLGDFIRLLGIYKSQDDTMGKFFYNSYYSSLVQDNTGHYNTTLNIRGRRYSICEVSNGQHIKLFLIDNEHRTIYYFDASGFENLMNDYFYLLVLFPEVQDYEVIYDNEHRFNIQFHSDMIEVVDIFCLAWNLHFLKHILIDTIEYNFYFDSLRDEHNLMRLIKQFLLDNLSPDSRRLIIEYCRRLPRYKKKYLKYKIKYLRLKNSIKF